MKAAVLAYHSHNIAGSGYAGNDHVALASDLRTITEAGARIVPLERIVEALHQGLSTPQTLVGLTFDDGPAFDYEDFVHRRFGPQRSFLNILRDFLAEGGRAAQPELHATSFVIASPQARAAMEKAEDCGYPDIPAWLRDSWWSEAIDTGLIGIGNHSWDHVHHDVDPVAIRATQRDNFALVDNHEDADREIRRAGDFINERTGGRCRYFAFPFGHVNGYLVNDYLPTRQSEHRMQAAFGADGRCVSDGDSVWNIPRIVCGYHWKSPAELEAILRR